jgi:hypothetical protein
MTPAQILDAIREGYPELLLADGFEDAVIGLVEGACRQPAVCYDFRKCVEILMTRDGMDEDMAEEYLEFNTLDDAYGGEYTPLFLHDWRVLELEVEEESKGKTLAEIFRPEEPDDE